MAYLPFVGLLQLVSVLVLRVLALLRLDRGVHPLLLHLGPREVQIFVGLLVGVERALGRALGHLYQEIPKVLASLGTLKEGLRMATRTLSWTESGL